MLSRKLILALTALVTVQAPAMAEIELKLADTMPAGHTIHREVTQKFIEDVAKITNGELKLTHYPGGQLGKGTDSLRLIQTGFQDIGLISPSLISDKMPLSAVGELPGMWTTSCELSLTMWELSREGGVLHEKEYKPNGVRALVFFPLPSYQLMVSNSRKVTSLADVAGLKLRAAGGAQDLIVQSIGAVPVRMAAPEMYESMSRGTIDGAIFSYQAATSYKLDTLVRVVTEGEKFGTLVSGYFISERLWNSLSESERMAIAEAGERATKDGCKGLDKAEADARGQLTAAGATLITFDAEDQKKIEDASGKIQLEWVQGLDNARRPGTETLNAFKKALGSVAK